MAAHVPHPVFPLIAACAAAPDTGHPLETQESDMDALGMRGLAQAAKRAGLVCSLMAC